MFKSIDNFRRVSGWLQYNDQTYNLVLHLICINFWNDHKTSILSVRIVSFFEDQSEELV